MTAAGRTAERVADFRRDREAQDQRFEAAVQGRDRSDTDCPEYREYYGQGEYAGGGTEVRLTYRVWLVANRCEPAPDDETHDAPVPALDDVTPEAAFWMSGTMLAGLAADGSTVARAEQARRKARREMKRARRLAEAS